MRLTVPGTLSATKEEVIKDSTTSRVSSASPVSPSRRRFIARAAAASTLPLTAGAAPLAAGSEVADSIPPNVPAWMKRQGEGFLSPPYGQPSSFEKHVVRKLPDAPSAFPTASRTPLHQVFGSTTPNGLFFERHHAGVPTIDPEQHRLMVHGMVERPLLLTMRDL